MRIELEGASVTSIEALVATFVGEEPTDGGALDLLHSWLVTHGPGTIVWRNSAQSPLGPEHTRTWLEEQRARARGADDVLEAMSVALERDGGPTLLDYCLAAMEDAGWRVERNQ